MAVVEVVTLVRCPPERLFDLCLDMDVHRASLAGSRETATTSTGRPVLGPGDEVTLQARHLGIRWRLTSRVTEYDRPLRFVDEQVRGPFRAMRHEHRFDAAGPGLVQMTDRMTVVFPLVSRALVAPYLRRLLRARADHLRRVAEAGT